MVGKQGMAVLLVLLVCITGSSLAQDSRAALTFRNVGLYGAFNDYGVSAESPFDFIVAPAEGPFEGGDNRGWSERLKTARKNGKRVIVNLNPQVKTKDGTYTNISLLGDKADDAALDAMVRVVDEFFAQVDIREIYAVSISEEQVFWNGQAGNLNRLYDKLKAKYDIPVFQWFSPSSTGSPPGVVYPNIKSDGWVADEYFLDHPDMEKVMRAYVIQQKPIIQTIYAGGDASSVPFVPRRFWHQVEVCRKYDIPTEFFTHYGTGAAWGMSPDAPTTLKRTFDLALQVAARAKSQDQGAVNPQSWDFVPWEIPTIKLAFASKDATAATYREPYSVDRPVRFINDTEIRGFADLRWDSSPIELRPRHAGNRQATVIYSFESPLPMSELRVKSSGFVTSGKDAMVSLTILDAAGKRVGTTSLTTQEDLQLKIPAAQLSGDRFKVAIELRGTANAPGEVLAGINGLDVEADMVLPKERVVVLSRADMYGGVFYEEDLRAMSVYHTAEIRNVNDIIPTPSGLHAYSPSRTVEVIQKFRSSDSLHLTGLRVSGNADEPGRAARFGIGVSLNGKDVLARKMSSGAFSGDLQLESSELQEKIQSSEFFVHVYLEGGYGVVTGYHLDAKVVK